MQSVVSEIRNQGAKRILLHLPDGIRPRAKEIQDFIKKETGVEVFIWAGSCYGACDLPMEAKNLGIDLLIHFGHTRWRTN